MQIPQQQQQHIELKIFLHVSVSILHTFFKHFLQHLKYFFHFDFLLADT